MFRSGSNTPQEGESINNYLTLQALGNAMRPIGMRQLEARNDLEEARDLFAATANQGGRVREEAERGLTKAVLMAQEWEVLR